MARTVCVLCIVSKAVCTRVVGDLKRIKASISSEKEMTEALHVAEV